MALSRTLSHTLSHRPPAVSHTLSHTLTLSGCSLSHIRVWAVRAGGEGRRGGHHGRRGHAAAQGHALCHQGPLSPQASGSRFQGPGLRIQDSGFRVQGPGSRVQGQRSPPPPPSRTHLESCATASAWPTGVRAHVCGVRRVRGSLCWGREAGCGRRQGMRPDVSRDVSADVKTVRVTSN